MTPAEVGRSYDRLAEQWSSDAGPRQNGIDAHRRALAFVAQSPVSRVAGQPPEGRGAVAAGVGRCSQDAHKRMFKRTPADGALGGHAKAVQDCYRDFRGVAREIAARVGVHV